MAGAKHALFGLFLCALAGSAQAQVALPGTDWVGTARMKGKISAPGSGSDSQSGTTNVALYFGPLASPPLGANQFRLVFDDGTETLDFAGSYSLDAKGNPLLSPDASDFEDGLRELIEDVCLSTGAAPAQCALFDSLAFSLSRSAFKLRARQSKSGAATIQLAGSVDFAFLDAGTTVVRVKLRTKSLGRLQ